MTVRSVAAVSILAGCAMSAFAGVAAPEWRFRLVAMERNTNNPAVNVPANVNLADAIAVLDESGDVAFRVSVPFSSHVGLWRATTGVATTIPPPPGRSGLTSIDFLNGRIAAADLDGAGIYVLDTTGAVLNFHSRGGPADIQQAPRWPSLTRDGRVMFHEGERALIEWFEGGERRSRAMIDVSPGGQSTLGEGEVNDGRQGAFIVRNPVGETSLVRVSPVPGGAGYTQEVIATTVGVAAVKMNNAGQISFPHTPPGGVLQIMRAEPGNRLTMIARAGQALSGGGSLPTSLHTQGLSISDTGTVVFPSVFVNRFPNGSLAESLWAADGVTLGPVVRAGQTIQVEGMTGPVQLLGGETISSIFTSINGRNQIAFVARLVDGRDAIIVARPGAAACGLADIAGAGQVPGVDGELTPDDIIVFIGFFFASDTRADIAGPGQTIGADGQFTADDIIVFIGAFFAGC